ncbi:hypothetical protein [Pedobacter steynii]
MLNSPLSLANVVILVPLMSTVAFGTGVPLALFIIPVTLFWAKATPAESINEKRMSKLFS